MARTLFWIALAALTGCATPAAHDSGTSALVGDEAAEIEPSLFRGTYWLPTTVGMETARGDVAFPLNSTGALVEIRLALGSRVGGVESPVSAAMAMISLLDATNKTVAQAMIMLPEREAIIETTEASAGACRLVFETHGTSDGASAGDYLAYEIRVTPRQA